MQVNPAPGVANATLVKGLGFRVSRLARTLQFTWSRELLSLGITPPLAAVLRGVSQQPGISVRALSRTLGTDAMSAKRCADELESLGFIRSGSLQRDRRPRTLTTTPKGRALVKRVNELVFVREGLFESVLGTADRDTLARLAGELESALDIGERALAGSAKPTGDALPKRRARSVKRANQRELSGK